MKKLFTTILLAMMALASWAYDCEVGGIYYDLVSKAKTAEVTSGTNKYSGSVTIPETFEYDDVTYSVTSIGYGAFRNCSGLTSVTIPNSVTSIGKDAFSGCSGLTSVNITSLEAWCNISFYSYDSNPLDYAHHLFLNGEEIKDLVIPNSVTSIGDYAFLECTGLTSVTIPNSVTSIGEDAFRGCTGLTSVNITSLEAWCNISFSNDYSNPLGCAHHLFLNGEEFKDLVIPNSVTSIGNFAFNYCTGLTSVTIPNSVTSIGRSAFSECSGLTSVTIPNSVTSIGSDAFSQCSGLTSVTIPNSVTSIGRSAFNGCSSLTSVTIGSSVTSIEDWAFSECSGLTSVTIPNSVTSIGDMAFCMCSGLTSVTIGSSVSEIGFLAFASCKNLETVTCYAEEVPTTGTDVFKDSYVDYATLKVPDASVNLYTAADQWKEFGTIQGINGGEPETKKCATPTISFADGKLIYSTDTEGAEIVSTVSVADAKTSYDLEVPLTAIYNITAYATKTGYDNSETATATLVWATGTLNPSTEAREISVDATPLLITQNGGVFSISGLKDGDVVSAYSVKGAEVATVRAIDQSVVLNLSSLAGQVAVLTVGDKAVKIKVE